MKGLVTVLIGAGALAAVAAYTLPSNYAVEFVDDMVSGSPGRTIVVLVDKSASIAPADRELYKNSLDAIGDKLKGGDRLLVASVSGGGRSAFRANFDVTVERTGVRLDQEEAIADARGRLATHIAGILPPEGGAGSDVQTRLLESIASASQAFASGTRDDAVIVLLSDGVEDSELADLSSGVWNDASIKNTLDRAKDKGLLPDLLGIKLVVIGAGGDNYESVEAFWKAYVVRTGAVMGAYGRLPWRSG